MARQNTNVVFVGIKGTVVALDRAAGAELWRTRLKGSDFVNLVIADGDLYAATKGEIFCLDPATGHVRWNNPLKGLGWGLVTIGMSSSGQTAVMAEKRRRDEQTAAAAGGAAAAS